MSYSALLAYILPTIEATLPKMVACMRAGTRCLPCPLTSSEHDKHREEPLQPGEARHVAEADGGEGGGGEVEGGDVGVHLGLVPPPPGTLGSSEELRRCSLASCSSHPLPEAARSCHPITYLSQGSRGARGPGARGLGGQGAREGRVARMARREEK